MASVNKVSGSNYTSSLYNSANVVSGLASGMDTESMIEGLVQSYQQKIQNLSNKATKLEWKQDAYRSIIAKMNAFSNKYTSYTSSTNLMSSSFFNSAVKVAAKGENAGKVTASGRTDSDVRLDSVRQLATSARYVSSTANTALKGSDSGNAITSSAALDLNSDITLGKLKGSLTLAYGGKSVSISFDEVNDQIKANYDNGMSGAQALADAITKKLGDQQITLSSGDTVSAADRIGVTVDSSGTIRFSDKSGAGNSVYISSASDSIKETLGLGDLKNASEEKPAEIKVGSTSDFTKQVKAYEYLSGKTININLDGTTKSFVLPKVERASDGTYTFTKPRTITDKYGQSVVTYSGGEKVTATADQAGKTYADILGEAVKKQFGSKVRVSNEGSDSKLSLKFEVNEGSNLLVNTDAGVTLGIGKTATNYLNTSKTLGELMESGSLNKLTKNSEGKYDFIINDVKIGSYDADTKLSDIMSDINANSEAGLKVNYSRSTREFVFSSKETGSEHEIKLGDGLASALFGNKVDTTAKTADVLGSDLDGNLAGKRFSVDVGGKKVDFSFQSDTGSLQDVLNRVEKTVGDGAKASFSPTGALTVTDKNGKELNVSVGANDEIAGKLFQNLSSKQGYTAGQDAKFVVTINGTQKEMTRGSNSVDVDGMTLSFKEAFNTDYQMGDSVSNAVTFERSTDSDKIVDAIKSMITDYNEMMSEIRTQYATLPYQNSSGSFQSYEPLSDDDKATMSESAIQRYEEKAKQGLLFGDSNLSTLYERMRSVFTPTGADSALLSKIGISTGYDSSDGSSYIALDESKLREALDNDPDAVAELFTKSKANGSATEGIMQGMKTQLDRYAGLTGATKGILVQQAGTPLNSMSLLSNAWQKQMDSISDEIEKWQDKLTSQVDRYTSMFSKLEQLMSQMNSQSSTLAGMMGG